MKIRTRSLLGTALVVALLLTACGGDDSTAGDTTDDDSSAEAVTVTFQFAGEPDEVRAFELIADAFEKENDDVEVELIPVEKKSDHIAKLVTGFAGGAPPDVFLVNYREYAQFATRGAMLPADRDALPDGFYDVAVDAFVFDGELQCVPQNVSSLVVYWNTAIFEAAGIDPPRAGWTWDDFAQTAAQLTGDDLRGLGFEPVLQRVAPFVWGAGGDIVDDPDEPTRLTFDTPEARAALEFIVAMVRDDQSIPTEAEVAAMGLEEQFASGRLAMLLESRRATPALREVRDLAWDVAPLPTGEVPASILHSDGYCVARDTEVADAAQRFVAFATSRSGQTIGAIAGRTVPSLESVAQGAFLDPTALPESDQVYLDAIPILRRTPVIETWPEIEENAEAVLTKLFYEPGYSVDDAIADLDERTRPLFAEAAQE